MPFRNQDITITLPEGAGPGQARVVIGTELPEPLASYSFSPGGELPIGGILFYTGNASDDYMFLVWAPISSTGFFGVIIGTVDSGVVRENSAGQFLGVNFEGFASFWLLRLLGTLYAQQIALWSGLESSFIFQSHVGPTFGTLAGADTRFLLTAKGEIIWKDTAGGEVASLDPVAGSGLTIRSGLGLPVIIPTDVEIPFHDLTLTENASGEGGGILAEGMKSVSAEEGNNILGFTDTTYTTAGAPLCKVIFRAPPSGAGTILFGARFESNTGDNILISVQVREGTSSTSGTIVLANGDGRALETEGPMPNRVQASRHIHVEGLTPGQLYNATMFHKMFAGNGDIFDRDMKWIPDLAV